MLIEQTLGNVEDDPTRWPAREADAVDVEWHECKRLLKKTSRGGRPVRVLLPPGRRLRHGDVLADDGAALVVVRVRPCELVVVRPTTARELATLAFELGNLHWPAEVGEKEITFVEDGPALAAVRAMGLPYAIETRRFAPLPVAGAVVKRAEGFDGKVGVVVS